MIEQKNTLLKYSNNVIWSLPCLFQYEVILAAIQKSLQDLGMNLLNINAYGSPATVWSGGRAPIVKQELDIKILRKLFNYVYFDNSAVPTLTFSRIDITKDDLNDAYANYLLDFFIERGARFIVSSEILRDYIKNKNSNAVVVGSILKAIHRFQGVDKIEEPTVENESNYYNKLLKEYDIVVVRPEYSKSVLLKQPQLIDDISRIEVLINQLCYSNCPNAPLHDIINSKKHIQDNQDNNFFCYKNRISLKQNYLLNSAHTQSEVCKLIENGVVHLKLQGRGESVPYIINMINLASQMFNFDGPNSILLNSVLRDKLIIEYSKFSSFIDTNGIWNFNSSTSGLNY